MNPINIPFLPSSAAPVITHHVGDLYEVEGSTVRKYDYAGSA